MPREAGERTYLLIAVVDDVPVLTLPISYSLAREPQLVCHKLVAWAKLQGYSWSQCAPLQGDDGGTVYQLDFTTSDGTAATALARVFASPRLS